MNNSTNKLIFKWKWAGLLFLSLFLIHNKANAQTVTYNTETVAGSNVLQGTSNHVFYILKVDVETSNVIFNRLRISTTGTYAAGDLTSFSLYRNTTPSVTGATLISNDNSSTGNGETIDFGSSNQSLAASSTTYLLIRGTVAANATAGNTFKINGAANTINITYSTAPTTTNNNQSDVAGPQTIFRPSYTLTTETLPAANVLQGTDNQVFYIFKLVVGAEAGVIMNRVRLNTTGTYAAADFSGFSLLRNTTASTSGATLIANDNSASGNGETLDFGTSNQTLAAGSTTYFIVRGTVTPGATPGNTFKINGAASSILITPINNTPAITDSQTDEAGLQTIFSPAYTLTTEPLAAANVLQGTDNHVFYIFKLVVGAEAAVTTNRIRLNTTGTYAAADFSGFSLLRNTTASTSGATLIANDNSPSGNGETLDFGTSNQTLAAGSTTYFIVRGTVTPGATVGNTFKINGASNSFILTPVDTSPAITNNQTDLAGLQTIFGPTITYSTETVNAQSVIQGTSNHVFYLLKVEVGAASAITMNRLRINTTGSYAAADITGFSLLRNTTASASGATLIANDNSSVGSGETLDFGMGNQTLAAGSTTYLIIRASVAAGAIAGNTFRIDGSSNALILTFVDTTPLVNNSQSDLAGEQLIGSPALTLTTEIVPAASVLQGTSNHIFYIIKIQNGEIPLTFNRLRINTTGNYASFDISGFSMLINTTASASGATLLANDNSVTGSGETIDFSTSNRTLGSNAVNYLIIRANVSPSSAAGDNFKIDGAASSTVFTFVNTTPVVTNSQSDVAGLQTIFGPVVTYSTEPVAAGNVVQGATNRPFYILKVVMGADAGAVFTNVNATTGGSYAAGHITSFSLYRNTTPSFTGGTVLATDNSSTGSGETITFSMGNQTLAAGSTTYLIIRATVAASAPVNNTFFINGLTGPATLSFFNSSPSTTNNQSNTAGTQTITSSLPVTLISFDVKSDGGVRRLHWQTSMEKDNDYFELERSFNGKVFSSIGRIDGAGTINYTHTYRFTDDEAIPGATTFYYRLKQVDFDGSVAYSRMVSTQMSATPLQVTVFPNPFAGRLKVRYIAGETMRLDLFAADGKLINSDKSALVPANGEIVFENLSKLPGGTYLLRIQSQSGTVSQKLVKE